MVAMTVESQITYNIYSMINCIYKLHVIRPSIQVHGGTTDKDIVEFVNTAQKHAKANRAHGVKQTVVFFDEANATDAIGLIKEVNYV